MLSVTSQATASTTHYLPHTVFQSPSLPKMPHYTCWKDGHIHKCKLKHSFKMWLHRNAWNVIIGMFCLALSQIIPCYVFYNARPMAYILLLSY